MNDHILTLAQELYLADHLHQYATILVKNDKLEKSYTSYREKILANAPFSELSEGARLEYILQARRISND